MKQMNSVGAGLRPAPTTGRVEPTPAPMGKHRRSIRLKGYDYAYPGAYFVTICTHNREHLFGEIVDSQMQWNEHNCIVQACWDDLPYHYPHVELDAFVVMPNHIHGIIVLVDVVGAGLRPAPTTAPATTPTTGKRHDLPEIVRAFKSFSARRINGIRQTPGVPVWQRNYYEHIIRDENELNCIREYVMSNPVQWQYDREIPDRLPDRNYDDQWGPLEDRIYGKVQK